jgi:HPt (histidine-containing phosphotransfer) domain-containing protein
VNDQSFLPIMRASHVIKGASSNLMCQQLRETATNLEQTAAAANGNADAASSEEEVKEKFEELKTAVDNFFEFLESQDI